jgi:hypothetical protein
MRNFAGFTSASQAAQYQADPPPAARIGLLSKSKPAPMAYAALKHFPYARIDRSAVRRTKRLGPAHSLSATRQVYPDEDTGAA